MTSLILHTITILLLTTVYFVNRIHCSSNLLHLSTMLSHTGIHITMITVQIIVPLTNTVDSHIIKG